VSLGAVVALFAAVAYGAADFCGGLASRRTPASAVLVVSQLAGLVLLGIILPFTGTHFYARDLPVAALAGCAAAAGIGLLYAALAVGRMGVVSPITAVVSASVPVAFGALMGERISALAAAGCAVALVAIVMISAGGARDPLATTGRGWREPGVVIALGSGLAIGVLYVALAHGRPDGRLAIVAEMRLVSIPLLFGFARLTRRPFAVPRAALGIVAAAGVLDMCANVGYAIAARLAPLAIAAVLTSLYPASTVLLAFVVLRERLTRLQAAGVACAVAGVAGISLGS